MKPLFTIALTACALLVSACGADETCACSVEQSKKLLIYERGGGFAPSYYRVEVGRTGRAVVEYGNDPAKPRRRVVQLSDDQLADLEETLEANSIYYFPPVDPEAACADCFEYRLEFGGDDYSYSSGAPESKEREAVEAEIEALPLPPDTPTGFA